MIPDGSPSANSRSRTRCSVRVVEANQSRAGLLSGIKTPVKSEAFHDHYSLTPGKELGRGKFAVVKKYVEKCTGKVYAAKFMRKRRKGQDCRLEIIHEIAVLELATSCPWVVNLHEVYETAHEMILVLEYAAGGEIFNYCVAEGDEAFKQEDVKRLMRQILEGMAFLHKNCVVHLDLKPQNILLTSNSPLGDIKIVDFGLSRLVSSHHELREIMGTPEYVAPEILNYEPISTATDMWSIGVLAYVMLTGTSPFLGDDKQETFLNISQINISYSEEELQGLEQPAVDFMKSLLIGEPRQRATAEECLQHPWLRLATPLNEASTWQPSSIPGEDQVGPVSEGSDISTGQACSVLGKDEADPALEGSEISTGQACSVLGKDEAAPALEGSEISTGQACSVLGKDEADPALEGSEISTGQACSVLGKDEADPALEGSEISTGQACSVLGKDEATPASEELIIMAAYTLEQCWQSEKESMTPEAKAAPKRFKFEEPFGGLPELPGGEFIY